MIGKQIVPQDEEPINQLVRVFDIAQLENNEPFLAHTYQLKELRYRIETIRMEFPPKNHYHKSGNGSSNGNPNKPRYEFATIFPMFFFFYYSTNNSNLSLDPFSDGPRQQNFTTKTVPTSNHIERIPIQCPISISSQCNR